MKVLGADLLAFYQEWPMGDDWYHDDGDYEGDTEGHLVGVDPAGKYDLEMAIGAILWQGSSAVPSFIEVNGKRVPVKQWSDYDYEVSLPALFRAWKSTRVSLVVTLEGEHEAALREFVAGLGGKVAR